MSADDDFLKDVFESSIESARKNFRGQKPSEVGGDVRPSTLLVVRKIGDIHLSIDEKLLQFALYADEKAIVDGVLKSLAGDRNQPWTFDRASNGHFLGDVFENTVSKLKRTPAPDAALVLHTVRDVGRHSIAMRNKTLEGLLRSNEHQIVEMLLEHLETGKPVRFKTAKGRTKMTQREAFEHALLVDRVASRFATEFPTENALKEYLKDHPGADKSKHTVTKDKKDEGGGSKSKKSDALAHTEAATAKKRLAEADKIFDDLSKLKPQVDDANKAAAKKFDRGYDKLFDVGVGSAKAAEKLLKQYGDLDKASLPGDDNAIDALKHHLEGWKANTANHSKHKDSWAHEKFQQAQKTSGAIYNLDRSIAHLVSALTG